MNDVQQKLAAENMKLVHHVVWKYYPTFGNDDEIISCATLGLCKATLTWDESKSKFNTYACSCIRNAIRMELRSRKKQVETISIDTPIDTPEDNLTIGDMIADATSEPRLIDYSFLKTLTDAERVVYDLRKKGCSIEEIQSITGFNYRKVLRLIRLSRRKFHRYN